jgi:single-strand DNA-binding protein
MINKYLGIGNLTKDPECKSGANYELCTFSIAINNPIQKKEVLYIDVQSWNRTAENCKKYLKKGARVFIEGRLKLETWQDKAGNNKSKIILVAEFVRFMPSASSAEKNLGSVEKKQENETINKPEDNFDSSDDEFDEIPF